MFFAFNIQPILVIISPTPRLGHRVGVHLTPHISGLKAEEVFTYV